MILAIVGIVTAVTIVPFVALALFERFVSPEGRRRWQRRSMPLFGAFAGVVPGWAVVETTGRRTGRLHRVPVGGTLRGDTFWFLVGDPSRALYLRNIEANPRVRVRVRGRWRTGTAYPLPDDDVRKRIFSISPVNSVYLLLACREQRTVRVELDRPGNERS